MSTEIFPRTKPDFRRKKHITIGRLAGAYSTASNQITLVKGQTTTTEGHATYSMEATPDDIELVYEWMALSENLFEFWDNEIDAVYDNM